MLFATQVFAFISLIFRHGFLNCLLLRVYINLDLFYLQLSLLNLRILRFDWLLSKVIIFIRFSIITEAAVAGKFISHFY